MAKKRKRKKRMKPVTARKIRVSIKRRQLRIRGKTLEVRRPVSMRGRTQFMEAPAPGQPTVPQELLLVSTAIRRFKYWTETKRLRIWFVKGGVYDYSNVPESVVILLSQAQSKGRFFYYNIRTIYNYSRIR